MYHRSTNAPKNLSCFSSRVRFSMIIFTVYFVVSLLLLFSSKKKNYISLKPILLFSPSFLLCFKLCREKRNIQVAIEKCSYNFFFGKKNQSVATRFLFVVYIFISSVTCILFFLPLLLYNIFLKIEEQYIIISLPFCASPSCCVFLFYFL